jgi:hypothetical protein
MSLLHIKIEFSEAQLRRGLARICRHKEAEADGTEASCKSFGYLRGIRDQATSVEFRFRDGNSMRFPYGWMGSRRL